MITIVTSHWKENLDWLKKSKYPVVLIDKMGADPSWLEPQHIIPVNKGKEVSVYLKFIIENYDNLPDFTAFIHGHETSVHQLFSRPLLEVIECANTAKYDFIPLNNISRMYNFINESTTYMKVEDLWATWFPWQPPPAKKTKMLYPAGAQFIVARNLILKTPKSRYEFWYNKLLEYEWPSDGSYPMSCPNTFFEIFWHIIFDQPHILVPRPDWFTFEPEPPRLWTPNCFTTDEPEFITL